MTTISFDIEEHDRERLIRFCQHVRDDSPEEFDVEWYALIVARTLQVILRHGNSQGECQNNTQTTPAASRLVVASITASPASVYPAQPATPAPEPSESASITKSSS